MASVLAVIVGGVLLVGCGPSEARTALAIEHPSWVTVGSDAEGSTLRFVTECADVVEVSVQPDVGVDGLPRVTVWGHPRIGRCRPEVVVVVPAGTTRLEDGTTGMVVDLPSA